MHWYFCKYSVNLPDSGVSKVSYKIKSLSSLTQFIEGYLLFTPSRRRGQGTILIPYSEDSTQTLYAKIKLCELCMGLIVTRLILAFCLYLQNFFCFVWWLFLANTKAEEIVCLNPHILVLKFWPFLAHYYHVISSTSTSVTSVKNQVKKITKTPPLKLRVGNIIPSCSSIYRKGN